MIGSRIAWGLIPAVPVPFRGPRWTPAPNVHYAAWMSAHPVAGVAVWAHTGRGPHLSPEQRRETLDTWREALPDRVVVAGARDITMAIEARRGRADALLAFPERADPVGYHRRLSRELPVIAFYLYEAAGGVAYDDATLHAILELPGVLGIKVATLDSVMTFQRIAALMRSHPDKLLITGEDRFLGYSVMAGATAALIGMGAALPEIQAELLTAWRDRQWERFVTLSAQCDRLAQVTFARADGGIHPPHVLGGGGRGCDPARVMRRPVGSLACRSRSARSVEQVVADARAARA